MFQYAVKAVSTSVWVYGDEKLWSLTGHVPHLRLIVYATAQQAAAGWSVAIVITRVKVGLVLLLLFQGQLVEVVPKGKLPVDLLLGDAKVDHIEEPLGPDDLDELLGQLGIAFNSPILCEVDGGNCSRSEVLLSGQDDVWMNQRSAQSRSSFVSGTYEY